MERSLLFSKFVTSNIRQFSTSSVCSGRRNFRNLALYNFRGNREFRTKHKELSKRDPDIPYYTYGVREPGFERGGEFHLIPEMIPELIVPDLTNCNLKPYVSYRAADVEQGKFTAKDLFNAVYSVKIKDDFKEGKLDENGNPKNPNAFEKLTSEEAMIQAKKLDIIISGYNMGFEILKHAERSSFSSKIVYVNKILF